MRPDRPVPSGCGQNARLRCRVACPYSRYGLHPAPGIHRVLATTHHASIIETGLACVDDYTDRREGLVRSVRAAGTGSLGLAKDTSNLFRDRAVSGKRLLDVRSFNHILSIDAANGWIDAEGMATYEDLVSHSLGAGLMPAVVPQLKTITLGGAAAGVGIEASSFKYGLVHESLLELDVLTGDGRALICRPDNEYSDLFYGFPNSYGTLGYALRLRARAIPVKPFVELAHRRFT